MTLILTPWAKNACPDLPLGAKVIQVIDGGLVSQNGVPLATIFGLPDVSA